MKGRGASTLISVEDALKHAPSINYPCLCFVFAMYCIPLLCMSQVCHLPETTRVQWIPSLIIGLEIEARVGTKTKDSVNETSQPL